MDWEYDLTITNTRTAVTDTLVGREWLRFQPLGG